MRFQEFKLSEATLQRTSSSSWPNYLVNLISAKDIGLGPQGERASGLELTQKSKAMLKAMLNKIDKSGGKLDREMAQAIEELEVSFTDGTVAPIKHIHKSKEIKGGVNASGSEKKPWNEGEVAETILGAALYARFMSKTNISKDDVWSALREFTNNPVPGGFRISGSKRNKKSPIDMIALNKPLNNKVIEDIVSNRAELEKQFPNGVEALESKIAATAAYVNESSKVIKALEEADANPGSPITIKTDGVGDQKGTKADLQIEIGQWKQLLSLKVNDVKQFGQESGSSGTIVASFFQRFIPDLDLSDLYMQGGEPMPWTPQTGKGWPDMDDRKAVKQLKQSNLWDAALDQVYTLTGLAYQRAAAHLQSKLTTPDGAAEVVTNIYNGIIHHVQGNAQFQTLVILNPTTKVAWKELEFGPELEQALGHYNLEVQVEVGRRGANNHKLRIFGTPATPEAQIAAQTNIQTDADAKKAKQKAESGQVTASNGREMLFQLRSYQQESGNMRNPVEMGPLLKNLTEVQRIEDVVNDEPEKTAPQPAASQPNTAKPQPTAKQPTKQPQQQQTTANTPVQPLYGPNVNDLQNGEFASANEPLEYEEPVREDTDLSRIKKLSGISAKAS